MCSRDEKGDVTTAVGGRKSSVSPVVHQQIQRSDRTERHLALNTNTSYILLRDLLKCQPSSPKEMQGAPRYEIICYLSEVLPNVFNQTFDIQIIYGRNVQCNII